MRKLFCILILALTSTLAYAQRPDQIELPCPAGSSPTWMGQSYDQSTGKYRQWLCADNNGNIFVNTSSIASTGAINITAGGTNQNITLTPSGTGLTVCDNCADKGGQVYNFAAYYPSDVQEKIDTNCAISSTVNTTTLTCTGGSFASTDVGLSIVVNGAGTAGADLSTTIAGYTSATVVTVTNAASTTVSGKTAAYGTDITSDFNALLTTIYNAGGGILFVRGKWLVLSQIVIPNNGANPPFTNSIRIEGLGPTANGLWTAPPAAPSVLDLRANSNYGAIYTTGAGVLEVDHMGLEDAGTDCGWFVYTQDTTLHFHDNLFTGTHTAGAACNGVFQLGAANFQGYGTYINHNYFDQVSEVVDEQANANGLVISGNTVSKRSGGVRCFFIQSGEGNYISGNLVEDTYYTVAFYDGSGTNVYVGNQTWDASSTSRAYQFLSSNSVLITARDDEVVTYGITHLFNGGSVPTGFFPDTGSTVAFHLSTGVFSTLPACNATLEGTLKAITDSATTTWGATITGTGTNHVLGYCDGTNWTVAAQ